MFRSVIGGADVDVMTPDASPTHGGVHVDDNVCEANFDGVVECAGFACNGCCVQHGGVRVGEVSDGEVLGDVDMVVSGAKLPNLNMEGCSGVM